MDNLPKECAVRKLPPLMSEERLAQTRRFLAEVLAWIGTRRRILIVLHDNPDPDCLASAMALRHLLVMKLNREPVIAFSGMIGRSENLAMAKDLEIPLVPFAILDPGEFQAICMLDTQPETGNNSLPPGTRVDLVIDHHPLREKTKLCRFVDVREDYGVTATILYEYLVSQDLTTATKLATALFYAIKSETQDLGREANRPDREAYLRLFPLTNKRLLYEITHPTLPIEYFNTMSTALRNTRIHGGSVVSNLGKISFPEIVAELADLMVRLEGIDTSLSMGLYNAEMILSVRTLRHDWNGGEGLKRIVDGRGAAGGHGMTAGGKIDMADISPAAIREVEEYLTKHLLEELGLTGTPSRPLLDKDDGH